MTLAGLGIEPNEFTPRHSPDALVHYYKPKSIDRGLCGFKATKRIQLSEFRGSITCPLCLAELVKAG